MHAHQNYSFKNLHDLLQKDSCCFTLFWAWCFNVCKILITHIVSIHLWYLFKCRFEARFWHKMVECFIYRIAGYFCGYKFLRFGPIIDWINFCGFYFCGRRSKRNNFCGSNIGLIKGRIDSIKSRVVWHLYSYKDYKHQTLLFSWFPIISVNKILIYNQIWSVLVKNHLKLKTISY